MKRFFKKLGSVLMCLLPFLITLGLQLILTFPVLIYYLIGKYSISQETLDLFDIINNITQLATDSDFVVILTLTWAVSSTVLFFIWYQKVRNKKEHSSFQKLFSPLSLIGLLLMVVGMQILINFVYSGVELFHPEWFTTYKKLMDQTNFSTIGAALMTIYAIFGAPIHEELVFRGVTLHYAKKAMPFWLANLLQALLFGVMHLNIIQGTYAFVAGLLLGYVYQHTKSLRVSIIFHMLFNLMGSLPIFNSLGKTLPPYVFLSFIGCLITVMGITLFHSKKISPRTES